MGFRLQTALTGAVLQLREAYHCSARLNVLLGLDNECMREEFWTGQGRKFQRGSKTNWTLLHGQHSRVMVSGGLHLISSRLIIS